MRVQLLGPVTAYDEAGSPLPLGGTKQRALFADLALAWPRSRSTEQLIDLLWGDDPPASAKNAVQVYVTGLRKVLAPEKVGIARVSAGYALQGAGLDIDLTRFTVLLAEGRAALRTGEHQRAAQRLAKALSLWSGDPLDGMDDSAGHRQARDVLVVQRLSGWVDLADSLLRCGRPDEAVAVATALLTQHPLDERGWIALATGHYRAGRQSEALQACRRVRRLLADELGTDPSTAVVTLESQILRHELPAGGAAPAASSERPLPGLPDPFVGRDALVAELVQRVTDGQRLITLVGLGGMGKTTVAKAVALRTRDLGTDVLFAELETQVDTGSAVLELCSQLGAEAGDRPEESLAEAARGRLVVLDNVEQIPGLGPVLTRLLRASAGVQLILTSRRPLRVREEQVVAVPPLSHHSPVGSRSPSEDLFWARARAVRRALPQQDSLAAVRDLCVLVGGSPLAIEIVAGRMRTLTPQQLLTRLEVRQTSLLDTSGPSDLPERQASLGTVLEDTVELLDGVATRLLERLGSYEGWVSLELLEATTQGAIGGDFLLALDELSDLGLVSLDDHGRLRLTGPVRAYAGSRDSRVGCDREMVVGALALAQQVAPSLVGRSAAAGLARLRRDAETLDTALRSALAHGWHAEVADLTLALHRYWLLSGRVSYGRTQLAAVLADATVYVEVSRIRLQILAGTFASYLGDDHTTDELAPALAAAEDAGLPPDRILVNGWCCLAAHHANRAELESAWRCSERAKLAAAAAGDPTLVTLARDLDGHVATYAGDRARGLAAKLGGIADARHSGDDYDLIVLLAGAAEDLIQLDRPEEGLALAEEAFERATLMDAGPLVTYVVLMRGWALAVCGQTAAACGGLREALRLGSEQHGSPVTVADATFALAACAADLGRDHDSARLFGAAEGLYADASIAGADRHTPSINDQRRRLVDRLGEAQFAVYAALGASDPGRRVAQVLDR